MVMSVRKVTQAIVNSFANLAKREHKNKFLFEAQRKKMKELWDNKEDEIWEQA